MLKGVGLIGWSQFSDSNRGPTASPSRSRPAGQLRSCRAHGVNTVFTQSDRDVYRRTHASREEGPPVLRPDCKRDVTATPVELSGRAKSTMKSYSVPRPPGTVPVPADFSLNSTLRAATQSWLARVAFHHTSVWRDKQQH